MNQPQNLAAEKASSEEEVEEAKYALPSRLIHDLRTPLNQILGYSEMLAEQAQEIGQEDFVADLQKVRAAGQNLLSLINGRLTPTTALEVTPNSATIDSAVAREPIIAPSPAKLKADELPSDAPRGSLLIVDDIKANRDVLSQRLKRLGHEIHTAWNGREALEMLGQRTFDLVLLDIMMPEMDGYEVLQRLKADPVLQHIPVIMVSALHEMESVVRCIELGAEDYLSKPFDPVLLKARIGASLEKKRGHDRETRLFEQLQNNYGRLQELEKQRDDLTNMIVHDLRTPLTSVMAGMQSLEMLGELNQDQQEMIGIALQGGTTLVDMIGDLLDVEKIESGAMQLDLSSVSIVPLIESAIHQISQLAKDSRLTLSTQIAPDLPPLEADESKLRRILVNLLGNAIKFTPSGGVISVGARLSPNDQSLLFEVSDSGEGIPAEAFARIFEKFGQVESREGGRTLSTGLGLTFCKLAVEAHGGHIEVESVHGKGSTFRFTIPLVAP